MSVRDWPTIDSLHDLVDHFLDARIQKLPPEKFYLNLVENLVELAGGVYATVWVKESNSRLTLIADCRWREVVGDLNGEEQKQYSQFIEHGLNLDQPIAIKPDEKTSAISESNCDAKRIILLAPLRREGNTFGILKLACETSLSDEAINGCVNLLSALCEVVQTFEQRLLVSQLQKSETRWNQLLKFVSKLPTAIAAKPIENLAHFIADEGRLVADCDRLSVVWKRGRRYKVEAVSGIHSLHHRSRYLQVLAKMAGTTAESRDSVFYQRGKLAETSIDEIAADCLKESGSTEVLCIPVQASVGEVPCVLIFEQYGESIGLDWKEWANRISNALTSAIESADHFAALPLRGYALKTRVARQNFGRYLTRTTMAIVALTVMFVALASIQMPLKIRIHGEMQPSIRKEIFAPQDGEIELLLVPDEAKVAQGDPLLRIKSETLELKLTSVKGQLESTRAAIESARTAILQSDSVGNRDLIQNSLLKIEEAELSQKMASLNAEFDLLQEQKDALSIDSPLDGAVITWDVTQILSGRPVTRGQSLMQIADLDGPWDLELLVPDRIFGHVRRALSKQPTGLTTSYLLESEPGKNFNGKLIESSMSVEVDTLKNAAVRVRVELEAPYPSKLKPGTTVVAKVDCGPSCAAYVLFHEFWDFLRRRVLF